jgi:hypothetical protein
MTEYELLFETKVAGHYIKKLSPYLKKQMKLYFMNFQLDYAYGIRRGSTAFSLRHMSRWKNFRESKSLAIVAK